jgi:hypothetical protein
MPPPEFRHCKQAGEENAKASQAHQKREIGSDQQYYGSHLTGFFLKRRETGVNTTGQYYRLVASQAKNKDQYSTQSTEINYRKGDGKPRR